jgi:tetraacyldisaccharide 4'-kinase
MREPRFWWGEPGIVSALLSPFGALYGSAAASRMRRAGQRAGVPVICIGNFTLGGTGKTPAAIAVAELLKREGRKPALLTRGYGGSVSGPAAVDPQRHTAADVGDEALLLAQATPTIVSADRVAGAQAAEAQRADVIVMDDGLQNPSLAKDLTIALVDARRGIGNGNVFPAGPLRAPLDAQMERCNAVLVVGDGSKAEAIATKAQQRGLRVFRGALQPDEAAIGALSARPVVAFAGIGDPEKFFATLRAAGVDVKATRAFPDHHRFTAEEGGDLIMQAEHDGLRLVTTAKDHARITGEAALSALAERAYVLPVTMQVKETEAWRSMLLGALKR